MLVRLKGKGTLSARQACVLAFWACRAGAKGPAEQLALPPNRQSGKYSAKYDRVVHADMYGPLDYNLELPAYNKYDSTRETTYVPVQPAFDAL